MAEEQEQQGTGSESAVSELRRLMDEAGLGAIAEQVWQLALEKRDLTYIYEWVLQQPEYKDRFSGLVELRDKGVSAGMSEGDYLNMEAQMSGMLVMYGLGSSQFNTPEYLGEVIGAQVSPDEFDDRVQMARAASNTLPPEVRQQLSERYGINSTNVLAYYLDTDRVADDLVRQQQAASVAAEYERFQSAPVETPVFENLTRQGVDISSARQQFAALGTLGQGLTTQERLEGVFGLNEMVQRERERRLSEQAGSGGATAGERGVSGLGVSTTG